MNFMYNNKVINFLKRVVSYKINSIYNNKEYYLNLFDKQEFCNVIGQLWLARTIILFKIFFDIFKNSKNKASMEELNYLIEGSKEEKLEKFLLLKNNLHPSLTVSEKTMNEIEFFLKNIPEYNANNQKQSERVYEIYDWYTKNLSVILNQKN